MDQRQFVFNKDKYFVIDSESINYNLDPSIHEQRTKKNSKIRQNTGIIRLLRNKTRQEIDLKPWKLKLTSRNRNRQIESQRLARCNRSKLKKPTTKQLFEQASKQFSLRRLMNRQILPKHFQLRQQQNIDYRRQKQQLPKLKKYKTKTKQFQQKIIKRTSTKKRSKFKQKQSIANISGMSQFNRTQSKQLLRKSQKQLYNKDKQYQQQQQQKNEANQISSFSQNFQQQQEQKQLQKDIQISQQFNYQPIIKSQISIPHDSIIPQIDSIPNNSSLSIKFLNNQYQANQYHHHSQPHSIQLQKDADIQTINTPVNLIHQQIYFQRAKILKYLSFNKQQYKIPDMFPKLSKEIGRQFYDGQFQPSNQLFTQGHRQKGVPVFKPAFEVPHHKIIFKKRALYNFPVMNSSNYLQNITAALNFLYYKDSEFIYKLFQQPNDNSQTILRSIWLFPKGQIKPQFIDDIVPCTFHMDPYFNHSKLRQISILLLQKALAKAYGNYSLVSKIPISIILKTMTGAPTVFLDKQKDLDKSINRHLQRGSIIIGARIQNIYSSITTLNTSQQKQLHKQQGLIIKQRIIKQNKNIPSSYFMVDKVLKLSQYTITAFSVLTPTGQKHIIQEQDFIKAVKYVVSVRHIQDYFYCYESIILYSSQVYNITFYTKQNHFHFILIQKDDPAPAKISLYKQSIDLFGKKTLTLIASKTSDNTNQFFMEVQISQGNYSLFIQANYIDMLKNLNTKGFNPLVTKIPQRQISEFVLGFYTRQRFKLFQPQYLFNQGSSIGNKAQCFIAIPKQQKESFYYSPLQIQEYIAKRNHDFIEQNFQSQNKGQKEPIKSSRKKQINKLQHQSKQKQFKYKSPKINNKFKFQDDISD